MSTRVKQFMLDELKRLKGAKTVTETRAMIPCPFHSETRPSGSINLDVRIKVPLGWFSCFGCKKSVPWDEMAAKVGMRQVGGQFAKKNRADDYVPPGEFKSELLGDEDADRPMDELIKDFEFFDFQTEMWRGFKTSFLTSLGCKFMYYDHDGHFYVWMPVLIKGKLEGYVRATMEREEPSSYFNAPGTWSKAKGLLFFDQAVELMKSKSLKTIVLCEGPRDALRLLKNGIPAMCVLGALNWTDEKRFTLEQSGAEYLILMMDGDLPNKDNRIAGELATKRIYKNVKHFFNTKYMMLWKDASKLGKKIDPGNAPFKYIKQVRDALH